MHRLILGFLATATLAATSSTAAAQFKGGKKGGGDGAKYGWLSSLAQGKEEARKTGKPLMVVIRCVP